MKKIALALLATIMLAGCVEDTGYVSGGSDGRNRVMTISNNTGVNMMRFYASNTGQNAWGPDQLGSSILSSGSSWRVNFDDGTGSCYYDFRAQFADGDVLVRNNINVCVESGLNYH